MFLLRVNVSLFAPEERADLLEMISEIAYAVVRDPSGIQQIAFTGDEIILLLKHHLEGYLVQEAIAMAGQS